MVAKDFKQELVRLKVIKGNFIYLLHTIFIHIHNETDQCATHKKTSLTQLADLQTIRRHHLGSGHQSLTIAL